MGGNVILTSSASSGPAKPELFLCKPINSFCLGDFELGFLAFATEGILIYPLFLLAFLLPFICLRYTVIFVLVYYV